MEQASLLIKRRRMTMMTRRRRKINIKKVPISTNLQV
jgi:hypothetical protein